MKSSSGVFDLIASLSAIMPRAPARGRWGMTLALCCLLVACGTDEDRTNGGPSDAAEAAHEGGLPGSDGGAMDAARDEGAARDAVPDGEAMPDGDPLPDGDPPPDGDPLPDGDPRPDGASDSEPASDGGTAVDATADGGETDASVLPDMAGPPACADGRDNNADGRVDQDDLGCVDDDDTDESDPVRPPLCANGLDDDGDGFVDHPDDPECPAPAADDEGPACAEGHEVIEMGQQGGRVQVVPPDGPALAAASCGAGFGREAVIAVTLDVPSYVEVQATTPGLDPVLVFARRACRSRVSEVGCRVPWSRSPLSLPVQPAGVIYVFVQWAGDSLLPTPIDVEIAVRSATTACSDGRDDDGDGRVDVDDPGCAWSGDTDERENPDFVPACANGVDDDGDGRVDHPLDEQCRAAGDPSEAPEPACQRLGLDPIELGAGFHVLRDRIGEDERPLVRADCGGFYGQRHYALVVERPSLLVYETNHGPDVPTLMLFRGCGGAANQALCDWAPPAQGRVERLEPGLWLLVTEGSFENTEYELWLDLVELPLAGCEDGLDNDADGRIDADDPGCTDAGDASEAPDRRAQCDDGIDNDGDGAVDHPDDPHCAAAGDDIEARRCARRPTIEVGQAGGVYDVAAAPGSLDSSTCGGVDMADVVFAVTLDEPSALRVESDDWNDIVYVRADCDSGATQVGCGDQTLALDRLAPGTWYVFVELSAFDGRSSQISIEVFGLQSACRDDLDNDGDGHIDALDPGCSRDADDDEVDPATPAVCANGLDDDGDGRVDHPADDACRFAGGDSEVDHCGAEWEVFAIGPEGGEIALDLDLRLPAAQRGDCAVAGTRETVIALTLDEPSDVAFSAPRGEAMAFSLRADCASRAEELACLRGSATFPRVPPGVWYVFVTPEVPSTATVRVDVTPIRQACSDSVDNDGDGQVDFDDPGCRDDFDDDELDPPARGACDNGVDDDGDGLVDFPADPDCRARGATSERLHCVGDWPVIDVGQDGGRFVLPAQGGISLASGECTFTEGTRETVLAVTLDEWSTVVVRIDRNATMFAREVCDIAESEFRCVRLDRRLVLEGLDAGTYYVFIDPDRIGEVTVDVDVVPLVPDCADDIDNDGDGLIDTADPGCLDARDDGESDPDRQPECADGIDNDGDGRVDWPADRECTSAAAVEVARCRAPVRVIEVGPAGGRVEVPLQMGDSLLRSACAAPGDVRETVLAVTLDGWSEVIVDVIESGAPVGISMRTTCDLPESELDCDRATERARLEEAPPGTLYVVLEPSGIAALTVDVIVEPLGVACADGVDNDGDGAIDAADRGCRDRFDADEGGDAGEMPCADGIDNDGDGAIDWPADGDCRAAGGGSEARRCGLDVPVIEVGAPGGVFDVPVLPGRALSEGSCADWANHRETVLAITLDELSDVHVEGAAGFQAVLHARTSCDDPETEVACASWMDELVLPHQPPGTLYVFVTPEVERAQRVTVTVTSLIGACNDGVDSDGDGWVDLADPGCTDSLDDDELDPPEPPGCADGIDNDGDGAVDFPDDPECEAAGGPDEVIACEIAEVVAVLVDAGGVIETDTRLAASAIAPVCGGGDAGEVVIELRLTRPASVGAEVISASYDTVMELRADCADPESVVACNDDDDGSLWSALDARLLPARTYFIIVDGYGASSGQATVVVQVAPL